MSTKKTLFRRSPHLVSFWDEDALVFYNYATRMASNASPLATRILDAFSVWRPEDVLFSELSEYTRVSLRRAVAGLLRHSLLERSDRAPAPAERAMEGWTHWNPQAGFFHFSTKDVTYAEDDPKNVARFLRQRRLTRPMPPPVTRCRSRRRLPLPLADTQSELGRVLLARRTWRRFSSSALDLQELGTLMGLTFGIQAWIDSPGQGPLALKTSPSGGARHPIEAYLLARRVTGLRAGIYHYDADEHGLCQVKKGASSRTIERYLPVQPSYSSAAAVVLMTAVFARKEWKYPYPAAYRSILLEAGHLCQTFCLVATALGLAPFCTAALAESRIERDLCLDGVSESVVYAAGVGHRPPGVEWAPTPQEGETPKRRPPRSQRRPFSHQELRSSRSRGRGRRNPGNRDPRE